MFCCGRFWGLLAQEIVGFARNLELLEIIYKEISKKQFLKNKLSSLNFLPLGNPHIMFCCGGFLGLLRKKFYGFARNYIWLRQKLEMVIKEISI